MNVTVKSSTRSASLMIWRCIKRGLECSSSGENVLIRTAFFCSTTNGHKELWRQIKTNRTWKIPCWLKHFSRCFLTIHFHRSGHHLCGRHLYLPWIPSYCWRLIGACCDVTHDMGPCYYGYYWCCFSDFFPPDSPLQMIDWMNQSINQTSERTNEWTKGRMK